MAFAALRLPYSKASRRWIDIAVGTDPTLGWIYYAVGEGDRTSPVSDFIARLQQWDPDNAVAYLIEAERLPHSRRYSKVAPSDAEIAEWRALMAKAFAAPRYETYLSRRFELEREVIVRHGWQQPLALVHGVSTHPFLSIGNILQYADRVLQDSYPDPQQRIQAYWTVANFGQRMQAQAHTPIEKVVALDLQDMALSRLQRALSESGRKQEAAIIGFELQNVAEQQSSRRALARSYDLSATVFSLTALAVNLSAVLAVASLVCVVAVGTFRLVRPRAARRYPCMMSAGLRYGPLVLVLSAVAFLLSYQPFAALWRYFMSSKAVEDYQDLSWFIALAEWPARVRQPNPETAIYLWWTAIVVGLLTCALLARRWVRKPLKLAAGA